MFSPSHPGEIIAHELDELGVSVADAARSLGVTRQQLYKVINGQSAVSPEMAYRLELGLGSTADAWLRLQAAHDLAKVRSRTAEIRVSRIAAGQ
jgi:addiction module HigA family antidote